MKNFFKYLVFFVFGLIVITSLMGGSYQNKTENNSISNVIDHFEDEVNNGHVIEDGQLEVEDGNSEETKIQDMAGGVGQTISHAVSWILKSVADLLTSLFN